MTLVFDKRGHIINRFHSMLPGGEKSNGTGNQYYWIEIKGKIFHFSKSDYA